MNQFSGIEFNDLLVQDQNPKGAITPEDISDDVECESEDDAKLLLQSGLKSDRIEDPSLDLVGINNPNPNYNMVAWDGNSPALRQ